MKAVELQAASRESFSVRGLARTAKCAGRTKTRIVNQDEQNVGRAFRRAEFGIGANLVSGSFAS